MIALALTQIINTSKKYVLAGSSALIAAAAAFTLASCSSDDEIVQTNYPADNIVRIDAGVNNMITRASVETGTLAGPISVSIYNDNPSHGDMYSYKNISVAKSGDTWTPASQMLWQDAKTQVTVIAYAPYKDLDETAKTIWKNNSFPVDVAVEQKSTTYESDFLTYKAMVDPSKDLTTKNAIPIKFNHAMSQLNITVKFGTELDASAQGGKLTSNPIDAKSLKVGGTKRTGVCDFTAATPTVTADNSDPVDIQPYESAEFVAAKGPSATQEVSNATQEYSCILLPQTVAAGSFKVSFTMNGKNYVWTSTQAVTLEGGNKYSLTITVGKDYVVAGNMTATPWTDAGESNIETD